MSSLFCLLSLIIVADPPGSPAPGVDATVGQRAVRQRAAMASQLKYVGIEPTPLGTRKFLAGFTAEGEATRRVASQLERLAASDFSQRETATRQLLDEPYIPESWLRRAASSTDPEVRWRASQVLFEKWVQHAQTFRAAATLALTPALPTPDSTAANAPAVESPSTEKTREIVDQLVRESSDPALVAFVRQLLAPPKVAVAASPPTATRPLASPAVYDRAALGEFTLVATGTRGLTLELDVAGAVRWRLPFRAWSAERRLNGRTLLASLDEQRVVEVDSAGQVLWSHSLAATRAKPLAGGRVLAVDYPAGQVVELLRDQTVAWRYQAPDPCFDAERLLNGHTLVACANLVQEVSPLGEVVWQWQVRGRLNGLQALASGNLLVANYGANEVAELDDAGVVVWRINEPQPSDAFRLVNGHTLVSTAHRVVEFDGEGKEVRVLTTAKYGSARR